MFKKMALLISPFVFLVPAFAAKKTDVVARVNSTKITLEDFEEKYATTRNAINRPTPEIFLEDLVRYEVGVQEAYKKKLQNDPIIKERMRQEMYKLLLEKAIGNAVEKIKVSEAEMRAEYKRSPELRSSHILFEFKPDATPAQKATIKKRALEVLREVKAPKRPFEQLVKLYSDDTISKANGGNVGYLTRVTAVPTYYNAAKRLKVGQIAPDLVETRYGFHIIKLTGRRTYKQADRTQLRAVVFEAKRKQIFDRYFAQLKKKYKISTDKKPLKSVKR